MVLAIALLGTLINFQYTRFELVKMCKAQVEKSEFCAEKLEDHEKSQQAIEESAVRESDSGAE